VVNGTVGVLGASLSRLDYEVQALQVRSDNSRSAAGRIRDADIAQEGATLVRTRILQRLESAVLAQANQQPALVLSLLRG
jgi:flagellin